MRRTKSRADTNDLIIGKRIRAARKSLGLSQKELGERTGVSFQQVQKYETGQNRVSFTQLVRFSEALDLGVHDLLPATRRAPVLDLDPATIRLVRSFAAIKDAEARRCIFQVIDAFLQRT
ncbi:MAG: XRE family transcriptional regulator [Betaproteobacteria bacterium]|nr:XRE family transcriptional regulator [Betaproteobacteria bacterium]